MQGFIQGAQKAYIRADRRIYFEWRTDLGDFNETLLYDVRLIVKSGSSTLLDKTTPANQHFYETYLSNLPPENTTMTAMFRLQTNVPIIHFTVSETTTTVKWELTQPPPTPPIATEDLTKYLIIGGVVVVILIGAYFILKRR